jgi:hypothetical protein
MRETLEKSFELAEDEEQEEEVLEEEDDVEEEPAGEEADVVDDTPDDEGTDEDEGDEPVPAEEDEPGDETPPEDPPEGQEDIRAPVSWTPSAREHWKKIPRAAQEEIAKRETEIQRGLQQASGHRKLAEEYFNTIQPFQGLMQAMGTTPSQAISTVMGTMAQLAQGTVQTKAQVIAQVIKDYDVDIVTLDTILSGQQLPADPNSGLMEQLDKKLQPVTEFMSQMQGTSETQVANVQQQAADELNEFFQDKANEFVEDVRQDMADYLDMAAKRGRAMTLKEAYDRACQDSPEIRKVLAQRAAALKAQPTGDELERKRRAASSVSGSPTGGGGGNENLSLHDQIAKQFEEAEGL